MSAPSITPNQFFVCCNRAFTSKDSFAKHKLEKHSQIISFRSSSANSKSSDKAATKINIVPSKSMSISVRKIPRQPALPPKPKLIPLEPQPSTSAAAFPPLFSNQPQSTVFYRSNTILSNSNSSNGHLEEYLEEEDDTDDQDFYTNAISQCTAELKEGNDEILNFEDENEQNAYFCQRTPEDCTGYGYLMGKMQYRCNSCYKVTHSVAVLKLHFESMHRPIKNSETCGLCGINVKHRCNFTRHLRTCHIPEGIPCPFCTCTFATQLGLNSHVVKIHSVEDQRAYLNIKPLSKSSLRRLSKEEPSVSNGLNGKSGEIKVKMNGKAMPQNVIKEQEDEYENVEEEDDDDPALYGNLKSEIIRTVGGKFYECRLCGKLMKSRINLRQHMLIHSGEKPLVCVLCGIKFRFECNRRRHMRTCHSTTGAFKCTLCSCKFTSPVGLKVHVSKYHNSSVPAKTAVKKCTAKLAGKTKTSKMVNGSILKSNHEPTVDYVEEEEIHKCDECGKILNSKLNLRNHKLIHTGEKPEVCTLCGQTFRLHSTLWGHMKVSHVKNGAFPCEQCACIFDTDRGLIRHKVIYHNFHSTEYRRRGKRNRSKNKVVRPLKLKIDPNRILGKNTSYLQLLIQPRKTQKAV